MVEWIVTSSVLIAVLIGVRYLFRGRISLRLQYALWLIALARLLIPVTLGATRSAC
jgi:beta-lactamase regulating signal transducer with metallopeptidase domain